MVEWMGRHLFLELIDQNIDSISPKLLVGLEHVALQGHLIKRNKVSNDIKIKETPGSSNNSSGTRNTSIARGTRTQTLITLA